MMLVTAAAADENPSRMEQATRAAAQTLRDAARASVGAGTSTAVPEMPAGELALDALDPPTRQKYLIALQRYFEYRTDGYVHRSRVFEWQLLASKITFATVLLLVLAGIYFAAAQFQFAMTAARRHGDIVTSQRESAPPQPDARVDATNLDPRLEVSAKGLVVNSSVLGVIILALSLAFFYLYLAYVYPIHNVF